MKTLKILLLCMIPILGIYSINKIEFGKKLVIMFPGVAPGPRPGGSHGPPPGMGQDRSPGSGAEEVHEMRPVPGMEGDGLKVTTTVEERANQSPRARPRVEEQNKWKIRIDFSRGIKNVGYLTLILAFFVELTYLVDRLIRQKSLF